MKFDRRLVVGVAAFSAGVGISPVVRADPGEVDWSTLHNTQGTYQFVGNMPDNVVTPNSVIPRDWWRFQPDDKKTPQQLQQEVRELTGGAQEDAREAQKDVADYTVVALARQAQEAAREGRGEVAEYARAGAQAQTAAAPASGSGFGDTVRDYTAWSRSWISDTPWWNLPAKAFGLAATAVTGLAGTVVAAGSSVGSGIMYAMTPSSAMASTTSPPQSASPPLSTASAPTTQEAALDERFGPGMASSAASTAADWSSGPRSWDDQPSYWNVLKTPASWVATGVTGVAGGAAGAFSGMGNWLDRMWNGESFLRERDRQLALENPSLPASAQASPQVVAGSSASQGDPVEALQVAYTKRIVNTYGTQPKSVRVIRGNNGGLIMVYEISGSSGRSIRRAAVFEPNSEKNTGYGLVADTELGSPSGA